LHPPHLFQRRILHLLSMMAWALSQNQNPNPNLWVSSQMRQSLLTVLD
jgi:hypothetical protein